MNSEWPIEVQYSSVAKIRYARFQINVYAVLLKFGLGLHIQQVVNAAGYQFSV